MRARASRWWGPFSRPEEGRRGMGLETRMVSTFRSVHALRYFDAFWQQEPASCRRIRPSEGSKVHRLV